MILTKETVKSACTEVLSGDGAYTPAEIGEGYENMSEIEQVGIGMFEAFKKEAIDMGHSEMPWEIIQHGYWASARGIGACKIAYRRYCEETQSKYTSNVLHSALQNPKTVQFFTYIARMPDAENAVYEEWFDMRTTDRQMDGKQFIFDPELAAVLPNPIAKEYAEIERASMNSTQEGACPAVQFIPKVFQVLADECWHRGLLEY